MPCRVSILLSAHRDCPSGQVVSSDAGTYPTSASFWADDGTSRGFTSSKVCVQAIACAAVCQVTPITLTLMCATLCCCQACVNKAGFGLLGRTSQQCAKVGRGLPTAGSTVSGCRQC
jgi:hypothetical protein